MPPLFFGIVKLVYFREGDSFRARYAIALALWPSNGTRSEIFWAAFSDFSRDKLSHFRKRMAYRHSYANVAGA